MNLKHFALICLVAFTMSVFGIDVGKLPAPEYLDAEVTVNYPLAQPENVDYLDFSSETCCQWPN